MSRETIDSVAGLTPGHASKMLSPTGIKKIGAKSLPLLLGALELKLLVIKDAEALARISSRLVPRKVRVSMRAVRNRRGLHGIVSKKFLRKIAPLGGHARARTLSPAQRRRSARKAALARWADVKAADGGTRKRR